ncbi:MAG: helix-turn-helix domain-containing protein [Ruminococcus sp.]|nr:helix-turn-helix domain-containing protein [Ruminococcus sp.]
MQSLDFPFNTPIYLGDVIMSRIQYASNLLKHSEMSIEEIAEACLYSTSSYFVRQFKKIMGMTPDTYRNANRKIK